jgi:receptor protein-tyrosine kinase
MAALIDELTRRLDNRFIIIDMPPCMASSDPAALAPLVGQVIFVEAYSTQQAEIEAALTTLSACPRISLLLNKSDRLASEHFGSYGYYYHSAGGGDDEPQAADPA